MASTGGLFLQVKLDTAAAERSLQKLGRELSGALSPDRAARAAAQAVAANARLVAAEQKSAAAAATASSREAVQASRERVQSLKVEATQAKATADAEKAKARTIASTTAQQNAQTRATTALTVEQQRLSRLTLQDTLLRRRRDELRVIKEQQVALRAARAEAEKLAKLPSAAGTFRNIAGAGTQDVLVGLGAARSGNVAYGLAAAARGFQAVGAAASGASLGIVAASVAIVGVAAAAVTTGAVIGVLAQKFITLGTVGATNFELLRIQLQSLLGSASRGQEEFDWLLRLGQTSIVPTQALIEADRTLLSFGVTADNVRRSLVTFISEFGTAVGATQDQIYFLALAVSQVVAKGKADSVDLRQIANAGVNTQELLTQIGEKTGRTYAEMQKALSDGKLTADQLLLGLITYGQKFSEGADAAAGSVKGLRQNIEDTFSTLLNNSFLSGGVLDPIKEFLSSISDSLRGAQGLFTNLAGAARNLFDAVLGGGTAQAAVGFLDNLFRNVLPGAVNGLANLIRSVRPAVEALAQSLQSYAASVASFFQSIGPLLPIITQQLRLAAGSIFLVLQGFAATGTIAVSAMTAAVRGVQALFQALTGNFDGAFASIRQGLIDLASGALRVQAIVTSTRAALEGATYTPPGAGDDARGRSAERRGGDSGTSPVDTNAVAADASQQAAAASAAAQKIAAARDALFNLIKSAFGQPSQALAGLFGDGKTFSATASSIASSATQIIDALSNIPGSSGIADYVKQQTRELLALAKQRDGITKELEEAERKLQEQIDARDALIKQLKDQAQSFVFNLNVGQTTAFRRLDGAGSFAETTVPESFAASVQRRLQEYKRFVSNIRKLQKAGLDKSIIRQFLEAGPEAAGAIVAQIAGSGAGVITDLNNAQRDLNKLAKEFGIEQGGIFYNAGVQQAQNLVDGLEARQAAINAAAKKAANAILAAVKPLAAKMTEAGAAAGAALGSALNSSLGDLTLPSFGDGAFDGLLPDEDKIREDAEGIVDTILSVLGAREFFSKLNTIAAMIRGALVSAFETARTRIGTAVSRIAALVDEKLSWDWLTDIPGSAEILAALKRALDTSVLNFLRDLPLRFVGNGGVWGFLLSGIPSSFTIYDKMKGVYNGFAAILRQMIRAWNKLDFSFTFKVGPYTYTVDDIIPDISGVTIPALASGGIAPMPTLAMVGDNTRAAEAIVPLTPQGISTFAEGVGVGSGNTLVRVFIGDRELRDIVKVEVSEVDAQTATAVRSGRRY